jgi:hypothetical protein
LLKSANVGRVETCSASYLITLVFVLACMLAAPARLGPWIGLPSGATYLQSFAGLWPACIWPMRPTWELLTAGSMTRKSHDRAVGRQLNPRETVRIRHPELCWANCTYACTAGE